MKAIEQITQYEAERQTEEFLNNMLPEVEIGTLKYEAGTALKRLDEIAFREEVLYWAESFGFEIV